MPRVIIHTLVKKSIHLPRIVLNTSRQAKHQRKCFGEGGGYFFLLLLTIIIIIIITLHSMNRQRVHPDQQNLQRKITKQSGIAIFYS